MVARSTPLGGGRGESRDDRNASNAEYRPNDTDEKKMRGGVGARPMVSRSSVRRARAAIDPVKQANSSHRANTHTIQPPRSLTEANSSTFVNKSTTVEDCAPAFAHIAQRVAFVKRRGNADLCA